MHSPFVQVWKWLCVSVTYELNRHTCSMYNKGAGMRVSIKAPVLKMDKEEKHRSQSRAVLQSCWTSTGKAYANSLIRSWFCSLAGIFLSSLPSLSGEVLHVLPWACVLHSNIWSGRKVYGLLGSCRLSTWFVLVKFGTQDHLFYDFFSFYGHERQHFS